MSDCHDPIRHIGYLRQSLALDKIPLGLFLAAGCPLSVEVTTGNGQDPLIPDIAGLTQRICQRLADQEPTEAPFKKVLEHFEEDGRTSPNIEAILTHVRSMLDVAGNGEVRGLSKPDLLLIEKSICKEIISVMNVLLPKAETAYHTIAAWISATTREHAVQLFTPNYDLLMEQALENCRVPYFDGFVGARHPFFDVQAIEHDLLPARWARLWKLHGSINWWQEGHGIVTRRESNNGDCPVIHPSHLKYNESRRMPYLAMIDRLRAFFRQPSAFLVVCGYSFGDQHLNEVILQGLEGNAVATVFALLYGKLSEYPQATAMAKTRPNLSLLATDAAVVGTRQDTWPVQDKEDAVPAMGIKWVDEGPPDQHRVRAEFVLGDFAQFGRFLAELIGSRSGAVQHAE